MFSSVMILGAVARLISSAELSKVEVSEGLFAQTNLVAWCIVPFDAKKRGPEERAAMLEKLGFKLFAYDYRAEHISSFDAEMEALKRHHVRLIARHNRSQVRPLVRVRHQSVLPWIVQHVK